MRIVHTKACCPGSRRVVPVTVPVPLSMNTQKRAQEIKKIEKIEKGKQFTWSYGITTVPERMLTTLPTTLLSLKEAGFDNPILFVDGATPAQAQQYGHYFGPREYVYRPTRLKTFGNWVLSMWELYIRNPHATRFALFQDDFVTNTNLRQYLEKSQYPANGYCNLYTFPHNEKLAKGRKGWYPSDQLGKGAVALVFDLKALIALLGSNHIAARPTDRKRGTKSVDGAIVTALKKAGITEYVHNPSLVQHTGKVSSMGNPKFPLSKTFLGEEYDATSYSQPTASVPQVVSSSVTVDSPEVPEALGTLHTDTSGGETAEAPVLPHTPAHTPARASQPVKEIDMPNKFRIGLIGYNSPTGLGELNKQAATFLPVEQWMVIAHKQHGVGKDFPPGVSYVVSRGEKDKVTRFLHTIDTLLFFETPFYGSIVKMAKEQGKRVVCVPMIEWMPKPNSAGWVKDVDLFLCPTVQCYDTLSQEGLPVGYFPWPVDTERFAYTQRDRCKRFLYVEGKGGYNDRKGTAAIRALLGQIPHLPITIVSQSDRQWVGEDIKLHRNVKNNEDIYKLGDVLLAPHKFDGLGLGPREAMSCGLPVITTKGQPWNEIPAFARIEATEKRVLIGRTITSYEPNELTGLALAGACEAALGTPLSNYSQEARTWAESVSFAKCKEDLENTILGTIPVTDPVHWGHVDAYEAAGIDDLSLSEEGTSGSL